MFLPGEVSRKWEVCGQNMEESWKSAESIVGMQYVHQEKLKDAWQTEISGVLFP